VTEERIVRKHF